MTEDNAKAAARAQAIRRARAARWVRRLILWVGLPTLASTVYYIGIASDQYESVAVFSVRTAPLTATTEDKKALANACKTDGSFFRDAALARETVQRVIRDTGLREHFAKADFLSRLDTSDGDESAYKYVLEHVDISPPTASCAITLRARALSPATAHALAEALIREAGVSLNEAAAAPFLARRKAILARLQTSRALLSPGSAPGSAPGSVPPRPDALQTVERPDAKAARTAWERAALDKELLAIALENAKRHVVFVSSPSMPDQASLPKRGWSILTVLTMSTCLLGVLSLLGGAVREHGQF